MKSSRRHLGLTVPEVLIAIAMIGVLVPIFSTALTGNIRILSKTSNQTQGAEVMGYLGKQIVDGDALLLAEENKPLVCTTFGWKSKLCMVMSCACLLTKAFENQDI